MPDLMTREDVMHFLYSPSAAKFNRGKDVGPSCINQRLACVRQFYEFARNFEVVMLHPAMRRGED